MKSTITRSWILRTLCAFGLTVGGFYANGAADQPDLGKVNPAVKQSLLTRFPEWAARVPDPVQLDNSIDLREISVRAVEDLYATPTKPPFSTLSSEFLDLRNRRALEELDHSPVSRGAKTVKRSELEALMTFLRTHEVAGLDATDKYDPKDPTSNMRTFGFCYGRADLLYLELIKKGVSTVNIVKLMQVGPINGDLDFGRPWTNHVVLAVRTSDAGWTVVDPLYNMVAAPIDWVTKNTSATASQKTLLYIVPASRLFAYGGTVTLAGIFDREFPIIRYRIADNEKVLNTKSPPSPGRPGNIGFYTELLVSIAKGATKSELRNLKAVLGPANATVPAEVTVLFP